MELSRSTLARSLGVVAIVAATGIGMLSRNAKTAGRAGKDVDTDVQRVDGPRPSVASVGVELAALEVVERTVFGAMESTAQDGAVDPTSAAAMEVGVLRLRVLGLQELHESALTKAGVAGPVVAELGLSQAERERATQAFAQRVDVNGEEIVFEAVPLGLELELTFLFGDAADRRQMSVTVDGPVSQTRATNIDVDLGLRTRNQKATIATLRSIAAAQQQIQASCAIDTDADGGGEHGYFAELAGTRPIRGFVNGGQGISSISLDPTYLPKAFGKMERSGQAGVATRQGYAFQMFLPQASPTGTRPISGIAESPDGGATFEMPGASQCELLWCCYAWPLEKHNPPHAAYFINQNGDVISASGSGKHRYIGLGNGPRFDGAFSVAGDMGSEPALAAAGLVAQDRNVWTPVGN